MSEMTVADAATSKVSDDELRKEREKLEAWCSPQEFQKKVDAQRNRPSSRDNGNARPRVQTKVSKSNSRR